MELSKKFAEKARRELGESAELKAECLIQFRAWISVHPFIKKCRQDDKFLLQFLRTRKYRMELVFRSFENYFIYKRKYAKWFMFGADELKKVWELFECGYAYPLMERDDEGKRIILVKANRFDAKKFTSADAIRLLTIIVMTLMESEETQIAGISTISDFTGASLSYFNLFSLKDIRHLADCTRNATIAREKENFLVSLPSFAVFLFEIGRKAISEKLRNRLILTKSMDELKKFIDPILLPTEHGGIISEAEMMESFRKAYEDVYKSLREIAECEIDWSLIPKEHFCAVM